MEEMGIGLGNDTTPSGGRLVIGGALTETRLVVDGVNSHSGSGAVFDPNSRFT